MDKHSKTVLVTGASGFIGTHCVLQLLEQGYKVRGPLRNLGREKHLRDVFSQHTQVLDNLDFIQEELGIQFRSTEEAIIAMAESLIRLGVV